MLLQSDMSIPLASVREDAADVQAASEAALAKAKAVVRLPPAARVKELTLPIMEFEKTVKQARQVVNPKYAACITTPEFLNATRILNVSKTKEGKAQLAKAKRDAKKAQAVRALAPVAPVPGYKFFADIDAESEANQPLVWQDEHNSDCQLCGIGGDLLVCDMCTWVFHPGCLTPAVDPAAIPAGLFACCGECIAEVQDIQFERS